MLELILNGRISLIVQDQSIFASLIVSLTHINVAHVFFVTVLAKGEMEPERKETRNKVDEDRKHEYPFSCFGPLESPLPFVVPFCGSVGLLHNESSFCTAKIITYMTVHFDQTKT